jgi:predicted membrane protein
MVVRALGVRSTAESPDVRNVWAVLTSRKIRNNSPDFTGARVAAFMGGCELDLTQANIVNGPAVVEAFALMGGVEIIVPDDWEVVGELMPVMAGFEIKNAPATSTSTKQLIVRGTAIMSGVEVKRRNG